MLRTLLFFCSVVILSASSSAQKCTITKDKAYYLGMSVNGLLAESTNGHRVGKCYIVPKAASGACDMYVKSAVVGLDGDKGWPKNVANRGTGCVRAPALPKGVTTCYYRSSAYNLPEHVVDSFCTDDGKANAVAMLKHAIENDACGSITTVSEVPCDVEEPNCPIPGSPVVLPTTITLDRIRRCRNRRWFCNSVVTRPEYNVFGDKKMNKRNQKRLYISQVNVPPREKTRNIVLGVSGQQLHNSLPVRLYKEIFDSSLQVHGYQGGVTGQQKGYKEGFHKKTGSLQRNIDPNGVISRIMRSGYFSLDDTFVGLVFDARFNYEFSKRRKNRHEDGYYDYLLQRLGNDVGTIYLAGHSRGGCLALRLASRLNKQFPNARIIVHNFDGVCTKPGFFASSEFGVSKTPTRTNPFKTDWFLFTSNFTNRFQHKRCLMILSMLSGQRAFESRLAEQFRAFGHRSFAASSKRIESLKDNGREWYHEVIGTSKHDKVDDYFAPLAIHHLKLAMKSLPCDCGV